MLENRPLLGTKIAKINKYILFSFSQRNKCNFFLFFCVCRPCSIAKHYPSRNWRCSSSLTSHPISDRILFNRSTDSTVGVTRFQNRLPFFHFSGRNLPQGFEDRNLCGRRSNSTFSSAGKMFWRMAGLSTASAVSLACCC